VATFDPAAEELMDPKATIEVWASLAETAGLLGRLNEIPPHDRVTAARKCLLRSCLAARRFFANNPKALHEVLKEVHLTMLHLRRCRASGSTTIH
jgi:hypothetical protein